MNWQSPPRPAEFAETRIVDSIIEGHFPIDSHLPAEREFAAQLGVTRPTLREALQRLACDGWVEIHQGRPTRVRNYWQEGNLGVLSAISRHRDGLPENFVEDLLEIRLILAPVYAQRAVSYQPELIREYLLTCFDLPDSAQAFSKADFSLHHRLTTSSGNPIFTLILNGFSDLYHDMARIYFSIPETRAHSRAFYEELYNVCNENNPERAMQITKNVMRDSLELWQRVNQQDNEK